MLLVKSCRAIKGEKFGPNRVQESSRIARLSKVVEVNIGEFGQGSSKWMLYHTPKRSVSRETSKAARRP